MVSFTEYYWSDDDLRVAEQQRHTGGPLGDGTSDSAKTTVSELYTIIGNGMDSCQLNPLFFAALLWW